MVTEKVYITMARDIATVDSYSTDEISPMLAIRTTRVIGGARWRMNGVASGTAHENATSRRHTWRKDISSKTSDASLTTYGRGKQGDREISTNDRSCNDQRGIGKINNKRTNNGNGDRSRRVAEEFNN